MWHMYFIIYKVEQKRISVSRHFRLAQVSPRRRNERQASARHTKQNSDDMERLATFQREKWRLSVWGAEGGQETTERPVAC
jgi:hypothetical protein